MSKYPNKLVTNRKSPKNEKDYIKAYQELNKQSIKKDNLDIAAVRAKDGTLGHALLKESVNRSKDNQLHIGLNFICDKKLLEHMKKN